MIGRKKISDDNQRKDKKVNGCEKLNGMLNLTNLLVTKRGRKIIKSSLLSGERYSSFPGDSKCAFIPYPQMEVGKCCGVIKSVMYAPDRGQVFPSSFQHWMRSKRPQRPGGLHLFSP